VETLPTIGEFSRMTHLSVKALRHYRDAGVLAPAAIDPHSGYRGYGVLGTAVAERAIGVDGPIGEYYPDGFGSDPYPWRSAGRSS
jgi:hypothetical protein